MVFIPVSREQLIPSLINGYGDIAAANLTITENRKKQIDFTNPLLKKVKEILITGPSSPSISSFEDLSGEEIYVRFSSSYYERLVNYNIKLKANGKDPIILLPAPEIFEDSDILEMVNAGMTSYAIVDLHKARFWEKIFKKITLHENINFGGDASIGWAFRKNSPKLKAVLNDFVKRNKKGTYIGNILFNRYLKNQ